MNKKIFLATFLLVIFAFQLMAQSPPASTAAGWERYLVAGQKLSELLPKMPVLISSTPWCTEIESNSYYAFKDQTVYELTIISKNRDSAYQRGCPSVQKFGRKSFEKRLSDLRSATEVATETETIEAGRQLLRFADKRTTRTVIDDLKEDWWIALAARSHEAVRPVLPIQRNDVSFD